MASDETSFLDTRPGQWLRVAYYFVLPAGVVWFAVIPDAEHGSWKAIVWTLIAATHVAAGVRALRELRA